MNARKLPIGIQTFEELREKDYTYIDKTDFIEKLVNVGKPYFLSRPRRFGKSLFLSTLRSYFEGRKDLFEGLEIAKTETEWKQYPVFYLDFNVGDFSTEESFRSSLDKKLSNYEKVYGFNGAKTFADRFSDLLKAAHEKTELQAVVLVDEYDKPLLNAIGDETLVDTFHFEFKMDGTAKDALEQINSKDYAIPYKNDGRRIVKIGVNYSSIERQLTEWIIE